MKISSLIFCSRLLQKATLRSSVLISLTGYETRGDDKGELVFSGGTWLPRVQASYMPTL